MEGGRHGDLVREDGRPDGLASDGARTEGEAGGGRRGVPRSGDRVRDAGSRASAGPRPFHYACPRVVPLGHVVDRIAGMAPGALPARAMRLPVVGVRLTSLAGSSVHAVPTLTDDGLYLDHRDLAALEAGAIVPDLAGIVARIR